MIQLHRLLRRQDNIHCQTYTHHLKFRMLIVRMMHIADMPSVPEIIKQQESAQRTRDVKNIFADRMAQTTTNTQQNNPSIQKQFRIIVSANDLGNALQETKEILLYSYFSTNIEVAEFEDGKIKYFDRKGDGDFVHKLSKWLIDNTGKQWALERVMESVHTNTIGEQKQEELAADPLVASAMSLFENAEIIGVK